MDTTKILTQVLTIINYQDNKQQFIDQFLSQCVRIALMEALDSLGKSEKKEAIKQIEGAKGVKETRTVIHTYISEESYMTCLKNTSQRLFGDYIDTIFPTLTSIQQTTLIEYLDKVK